MKKSRTLLSAILMVAMSICLIAGATFALFTDQKNTNITVTSGNVEIEVDADISSAWSATPSGTGYDRNTLTAETDGSYKFSTGGTVTFDKTEGELSFTNIAPGDGAEVTISITNKSSVRIRYTLKVDGADGELLGALKASYKVGNNGNTIQLGKGIATKWSPIQEPVTSKDGEKLEDIYLSIELPVEVENEYQGKSCSLTITVYAVQANAAEAQDSELDSFLGDETNKNFEGYQTSGGSDVSGSGNVHKNDKGETVLTLEVDPSDSDENAGEGEADLTFDPQSDEYLTEAYLDYDMSKGHFVGKVTQDVTRKSRSTVTQNKFVMASGETYELPAKTTKLELYFVANAEEEVTTVKIYDLAATSAAPAEEPTPKHEHTLVWTHNETQHWQECSTADENCDYVPTKTNHSWSDWTKADEINHSRTSNCTEHTDKQYTETEKHSGGNATEQEAAICDVCHEHYGETAQHQHNFNQQVAEAKYLKTEKTCTSYAVYYKSCTCGEKGTETFEYVDGGYASHNYVEDEQHQYLASTATCTAPATYYEACSVCGAQGTVTHAYGNVADHDYTAQTAEADYLATEATCTAQATYYYSCSVCGESEEDDEHTFASGDALGHTYNMQAWSWNGFTSATLTFECSVCHDKQSATGTANKTTDKAATCEEDGEVVYTVTVELLEETYTATKGYTLSAKGHKYDELKYTDSTGHWNVCSVCSEKQVGSDTTHDLQYEVDSEDNSKHYQECQCGYKTESTSHALQYDNNDESTTEHNVSCQYCSYTNTEAHDESNNGACSKCGYKEEPAPAVAPYFKKVTSDDELKDGKYLIVYEAEENIYVFDGSRDNTTDKLDATANHFAVAASGNTVKATAALAKSLFTIDMTAGTIKSASGFYIGQTSNDNGLLANDKTEYKNTISITTSGDSTEATILSSGGAYLRFNSASGTSNNRFRYYKSGTYTAQQAIQLYILVGNVDDIEPDYEEARLEAIAKAKTALNALFADGIEDDEYTLPTSEVAGITLEWTLDDGKDVALLSSDDGSYVLTIIRGEQQVVITLGIIAMDKNSATSNDSIEITIPRDPSTLKSVKVTLETAGEDKVEGNTATLDHEDGTYTENTTVTLTVTLAENYEASVKVGEAEAVKLTSNTYTFVVSEDITLTVTFSEKNLNVQPVTITLTPSKLSSLAGSYGAKTDTVDNIQFAYYAMKSSNGNLQMRQNSTSSQNSYLYNVNAIPGSITSIVITLNTSETNNANAKFDYYFGNSSMNSNPSSGKQTTSTASDGVFEIKPAENSTNSYFRLYRSGSGVTYISTIEITYMPNA